MKLSQRLVNILNSHEQPQIQIGSVPVLSKLPNHDLFDFMSNQTRDIQQEYNRIQKRVTEDPGTAGDQGEENWATLLRQWLPPAFSIITKGRIISTDGIASPQIDILVLYPTYPDYLKDKKLYLAGGVAAAFECKTTLKTEHIKKVIGNCIQIKEHALPIRGTLYRDLNSTIIYGLLAHSHSWKNSTEKNLSRVYDTLFEQDLEQVDHPCKTLDIMCVADLGLWSSTKGFFGSHKFQNDSKKNNWLDKFKDGACFTSYLSFNKNDENQLENFEPIGSMLVKLIEMLSWQYPDLRRIAHYLIGTYLSGSGKGIVRLWSLDKLTSEVRQVITSGHILKDSPPMEWNEWGTKFN